MTLQKDFPAVSRETSRRLAIYRDLLVQWQKHINLVSNSTLDVVERRHFADCLQLSQFLKPDERVVDLGSGGGFPGLVVAMLLAESGGGSVDLIESVGKKCAFLREVVRKTGLHESSVNVTVHHARIDEQLPRIADISLITARALAPLGLLFELTETRITEPTRALFHKGERHVEELENARNTWDFEAELHPSAIDGGSVIIELHNVVRT